MFPWQGHYFFAFMQLHFDRPAPWELPAVVAAIAASQPPPATLPGGTQHFVFKKKKIEELYILFFWK